MKIYLILFIKYIIFHTTFFYKMSENNNKNELSNYINTHNNIILIDGSYFIFYRFYALCSWLKLAHPDDYEKIMENPISCPFFVEKFHKFCEDTFIKILKKYGNETIETTETKQKNKKSTENKNYKIIISKDCSHKEIWRLEYHSNYKSERIKNVNIYPFFEYFYNNIIQKALEKYYLIYYDKLESDDCIAILTKYILKTYSKKNIIIISSDKDYLQLVDKSYSSTSNFNSISLFDLKFKEVSNTFNNKKDLFEKIVNGDKSDNILPISDKKISKDKLSKYFIDRELFWNNLTPQEKINYQKNKTLIDFDEIPENLQLSFLMSILPSE